MAPHVGAMIQEVHNTIHWSIEKYLNFQLNEKENINLLIFHVLHFIKLRVELTLEQSGSERWVYLYTDFFQLKKVTIFILQIFKCGEKFVFDYRPQYGESKELKFESWFYPNCFSFPPFSKSFINSLFLR